MASIEKPRHQTGDPERDIDCQSALEVEFLRLIDDAKKTGWDEEAAMALMEVAADYVGGNEADLDNKAEFKPLLIEQKN